jgi:hypothetical protein
MKYFVVEPEVAGGLGDGTEMDASTHPPIVSRLHYQLEGWLGDVLLESYPCFIVTRGARDKLLSLIATGAHFAEVEVTKSEAFDELEPGRVIPEFLWLQPTGEAGHDDFGAAPDGRLVVSERALEALQELQFSNALVEPFTNGSS